MRKTIRENINTSFSLDDLNITSLEANGNDIIIRTQSGVIRAGESGRLTEGYVKFHSVDWGFSYVYLFDSIGNVGPFSGEKQYLISFIEERKGLSFTVMAEVYGCNQTKYFGHILSNGKRLECIIDICHSGDMAFIQE